MKKIIFLSFALGTLMFSCKKNMVPDSGQSQSAIADVTNLKVNGIVASNDSAFNIVQYAGSNAATAGSTNGTAGDPTTAQFDAPEGIVLDSGGNMFVADRDNQVIRKITTAGVVSVFAGTLGVAGYANGTGTAAKFDVPIRLAIDAANNLYVADRDNAKIRKITPAAVVSTIAGSTAGSGATQFDWPVDVAVTSDGTKLYVADSHNNRIQKIIKSGSTYTTSLLAGQLTAGFAGGTGAAAKFNSPSGVAIDSRGYVLVADRYNNCIREITTTAVVYRYAGVAGTSYDVDAPAGVATFGQPYGITVANDGCVYVCDILYHIIRRISNNGQYVLTIAGNGGIGNAIGNYSSFNTPTSIAIDNAGNFYVANAGGNNIRKMIPETRVLQITRGWTQSTPQAGITWYKYSGNGFYTPSAGTNKQQNVNVLDINLDVDSLEFHEVDLTNPPRRPLTDVVGVDPNALAAISGTFATYETDPNPPRSHTSFLRRNNTTLWDALIPRSDQYWQYHSSMFYMEADGKTVGLFKSDTTQSPFSPPLHPYMLSGAPALIVNSVPVEITTPPPIWKIQNLRTIIAARTGIAVPIVSHHVLLINFDGLEVGKPTYYSPAPTYYGVTTADMAQFIQQFFHATGAENFDGGGTSTIALKGFGDNGGVSGGLGVINFPAYDSGTPPPGTTAYLQQRSIGNAIVVKKR